MPLSRTPSPRPGGGWYAPGIERSSDRGGIQKSYGPLNSERGGVTWQSARENSARVNGHQPFTPRNQGWFRRNFRSLSMSLPRFNGVPSKYYLEKEKLGRGRMFRLQNVRHIISVVGRQVWRLRRQVAILVAFVLMIILFYVTPLYRMYKRNAFLGGGNKFVIILAAYQGGGVMEWKGPREWAIERDSIRNKRKYANRWGYGLEIVDMATKKRYAHEWRESWEKVDIIRRCMHEYPQAEWFWWLDLNTFIMEPSYSLPSHIFNHLQQNTYRDINIYNPLSISHPLNATYLDPISQSLVGDGDPASINMIVPQDCGGFNLGSFFVRRSSWTDHLLDIWWDPVHYEQKHMQWEHKEQDAFEYLYENHPWIRSRTAFIPQRKISSFPPGACGENNVSIHYREEDRDFVVNMAGCEWGRDCWGEMYNFRELSNKLNRTWWERFKEDLVAVVWNWLGRQWKEHFQKDKTDDTPQQ